MQPLYEAQSTGVWGHAAEAVFAEAKTWMRGVSLLYIPNSHRSYQIFSDASKFGMSAVLFQDEHFSRRWATEAQRAYHAYDQELTPMKRRTSLLQRTW